ncbi:MAG TPA: alpha/beta hydrolase [Actinoplanes sp.]|nr:alpha/beta hydrolase [Actinoplanes sp.]
MDTGVLHGRFSYARFGSGPSVVVLPGMALRNRTPSGMLAAGYRQAFRPLAADHTVSVIQRPRGLDPGTTTRDLAREYATVLDDLGPVDLVAMSTGGMIAQHLVVDRPDLVRTVSLVVTGTRLSDSGRRICERWRELAAAGRWRRLHGELGAAAVDGVAVQAVARAALAVTGGRPDAQEMADFAITVAAVLGHGITFSPAVPLLMVCGATDPFFTPDPRAVVFRAGHGLPKRHSARLLAAIRQRMSSPASDVAG